MKRLMALRGGHLVGLATIRKRAAICGHVQLIQPVAHSGPWFLYAVHNLLGFLLAVCAATLWTAVDNSGHLAPLAVAPGKILICI